MSAQVGGKLTPELTPRYALFGVRIEPEIRQSPTGRRAIHVFRASVVLGFLAAFGIALFAPVSTPSLLAPILLLSAVAAAAWMAQYRRLKPLTAAAGAHPVVIELSGQLDRIPLTLWLSIVPFVLLLATALYLHLHWSDIPPRFPVHWGLHGEPNRWANRSVRGVYGLLVFGALLNGWLLSLALSIWHGVRRSAYRIAVLKVIVTTEFLMAVISSVIAIAHLGKVSGAAQTVTILACTLGGVAYSLWLTMRTNALPGAYNDETPQEAWVSGLWYFNREDPAIAVPRRDKFGYAMNFARPGSWILIGVLAAILAVSARWLL